MANPHSKFPHGTGGAWCVLLRSPVSACGVIVLLEASEGCPDLQPLEPSRPYLGTWSPHSTAHGGFRVPSPFNFLFDRTTALPYDCLDSFKRGIQGWVRFGDAMPAGGGWSWGSVKGPGPEADNGTIWPREHLG